MVATSTHGLEAGTISSYDRESEVKAFDDSKVGVQGLVENGVTKVPRMFYYEESNLSDGFNNESNSKIGIPIIDLTGIHDDSTLRNDVVKKVRNACEKWGFFQVINHGIPTHVLDEMIKGTCRFHQQDACVRKEYYTRDFSKKIIYFSNFSLYQNPSADWRDTLAFFLAPNPLEAEKLPAVCRDIVIEYSTKVMALASSLFELLSEALGINRFHLKEMGCDEGLTLLCHYYPACPEPELTIGTTTHPDGDFMTILLQDQMGGLQFLHENQWIDVPPIHGSLIVNIGDLLQLVTNDKFISVQHRVLANYQGPRISVASIFRTDVQSPEGMPKVYGPIKELLSEDTPPVYRETSLKDFLAHQYTKGLGSSSLTPFKL
ncbi:1-aminocyclopropane-1-carboxylate oxidase homolog 1-like [Abrus precatorius]|uniref:1-aminocyclopropane-1-carboxylate oxidase homolog 1-like n=1 Tax=Abrus precatorius TaxID=3816 RepID=A0A8B8KFG9_ABRPR|nr:1-aminocyclopropane-1-carboxylate oxidase homolog 1-like [Abrus precatorius]